MRPLFLRQACVTFDGHVAEACVRAMVTLAQPQLPRRERVNRHLRVHATQKQDMQAIDEKALDILH